MMSGILLPNHPTPIPFSNAKTLLGQEFPYAIYDMRSENGVCLQLDALAIVAGTIQQGGKLYLLCPDWHSFPEQLDYDALRWNANTPISTPNFYRYFQQLVAEFGFKVQTDFGELPKKRDIATKKVFQFTDEQQHILHNLPLATADIHLITAPRGRGKSTLSGKLAEQLSQTHKVLITARSQSSLPSFWQQIAKEKIPFFAPDKLRQQIDTQAISADCWLFIDEAASLPLPMLHRFCGYFAKVVLTTTTQNYEGTGRGFSLKFLPQLQRTYQQWQLTKPLRWLENDPLEAFINRLLLLSEDDPILPPLAGGQTLVFERWLCQRPEGRAKRVTVERSETEGGNFADFSANPTPCCPLPPASQGTSPASGGRIISTRGQISPEICKKIAFYHLLAQAHYKTTPTDLRRLFDAPDQHLYSIEENGELIAGCWAMDEGGLDDSLTQAIWRGERRPHGNLVAQYLCFQGNLPEACQLRSVRISRLAVQPALQRQGYGKRLVDAFCKKWQKTAPVVDFVSVSFGLNDELLRFWSACGFRLVQITPTIEASSGYHSAMMILPLSEKGNAFADKACRQFERDLSLQPFWASLSANLQNLPFSPPLATEFDEADYANLHGFAYAKRSISACYTSLKRLSLAYPTLLPQFDCPATALPKGNKRWLAELRLQIAQILIRIKSIG
ncbi:MAG: GNAT family N-acetyltransferase [Pasteurellaceae bacterium]|nr:GNAT family N-acetyltransferase [Pasteurellaceae bacterium]